MRISGGSYSRSRDLLLNNDAYLNEDKSIRHHHKAASAKLANIDDEETGLHWDKQYHSRINFVPHVSLHSSSCTMEGRRSNIHCV